METLEAAQAGESNEKCGVSGYRIENNHYVVDVVWKDGKKVTSSFPVSGFTIVNPATKKILGVMGGRSAIKVLKRYAPQYNYDDFSWQDFTDVDVSDVALD